MLTFPGNSSAYLNILLFKSASFLKNTSGEICVEESTHGKLILVFLVWIVEIRYDERPASSVVRKYTVSLNTSVLQ